MTGDPANYRSFENPGVSQLLLLSRVGLMDPCRFSQIRRFDRISTYLYFFFLASSELDQKALHDCPGPGRGANSFRIDSVFDGHDLWRGRSPAGPGRTAGHLHAPGGRTRPRLLPPPAARVVGHRGGDHRQGQSGRVAQVKSEHSYYNLSHLFTIYNSFSQTRSGRAFARRFGGPFRSPGQAAGHGRLVHLPDLCLRAVFRLLPEGLGLRQRYDDHTFYGPCKALSVLFQDNNGSDTSSKVHALTKSMTR